MSTTTTSGATAGSTVSGTSNATNAGSTTTPATPAKEETVELVTADMYGIFVAIFGVVLSLFVLFSTGSILAVLVLWAVIALIITVLFYYGFITLEAILGPKKKNVPAEVPIPANVPSGGPLVGSEVFHISQNQFTYDEAPAVCAAFGAQLATLEQIIEAYNSGAEWCGYGWSAGGMALYPTQKTTWDELQREVDPGKRTACGRPGVNGGYFDPSLKFGVNCFGFKPPGEFTPPAPVPGTDRQKFQEMVNRFKEMLKTMELSPFSRNEWSGYDSNLVNRTVAQGKKLVESFIGGGGSRAVPFVSSYGDRFAQSFVTPTVVEHMVGDPAYSESTEPARDYAPNAPFGLKGARGEIGPAGPIGPQGAKGAKGDIGPGGPAGPIGPQGGKGDKGDKGDRGDIGPTGAQGRVGNPGELGPTGPAGPASTKGDPGDPGPTGPRGLDGRNGVDGRPGRDGRPGDAGSPGRDGAPGATGPKGDSGDKIGPNDYVWGVNSAGEIWRCKAPCTDGAKEWKRINGTLFNIDVGKEFVYGRNRDGDIFRCRLPCDNGNWERMFGRLSVISG